MRHSRQRCDAIGSRLSDINNGGQEGTVLETPDSQVCSAAFFKEIVMVYTSYLAKCRLVVLKREVVPRCRETLLAICLVEDRCMKE